MRPRTAPGIPADPREAVAIGVARARERGRRGVSQRQVTGALGAGVDEAAAIEAGTGPAGRREITEAAARGRRAVAQALKSRPGWAGPLAAG